MRTLNAAPCRSRGKTPLTNALFGLIHESVAQRRAVWPWASDVVFWGTNIGLAGFAIALITGATVLYRVFTPIMGLSILLAIVVYIPLLLRRPATEKVAAAA